MDPSKKIPEEDQVIRLYFFVITFCRIPKALL